MEKKQVLIVVDMQNDFINGSLANPDAEAIVEPMCEFIKDFKGGIIFTRDTHSINYLNTPEGKKLPVEHCIRETAGWCINDKLLKAARGHEWTVLDKPTFGSLNWDSFCNLSKDVDIYLCGTCTDICVISNALILKATFPEANIYVIPDLCAGLTKEKHEAAISVMNSCQIDSVFYKPQPEPLPEVDSKK